MPQIFSPRTSQKNKYPLFGVIRVSPVKRVKFSLLKDERQIGVYSMLQVYAMRIVLPGCQHKMFREKITRINIDTTPFLSCKTILNSVRREFYCGNAILPDQIIEGEHAPE